MHTPILETIMDAHFTLSYHGSICLLAIHDEEALEFLEERVGEEAQWMAGMLVIEPRYVNPIVEDLRANGWVVEGD